SMSTSPAARRLRTWVPRPPVPSAGPSGGPPSLSALVSSSPASRTKPIKDQLPVSIRRSIMEGVEYPLDASSSSGLLAEEPAAGRDELACLSGPPRSGRVGVDLGWPG